MKPKVLFVEDDPSFPTIYKTEFNLSGIEMISAADGEEGLVQALKQRPQVILLDIVLPKISGIELLKRLKEQEETKHIPIFILTNFGQEDNVKKAFELGAADVFLKYQITPQEAVAKIKTTLAKEENG